MPPYYHGGHGRDNETKHLPSLCYIYVTFMLKWQKKSCEGKYSVQITHNTKSCKIELHHLKN